MNSQEQFCTFYLDGNLFGVEVAKVQEVLRHQAVTPVPLAPPVLAGLINLRGEVVPALELRRRFGMAERTDHAGMNVVIRSEDGAVSLVVDEIGDIVDVEQELFEPPPDTLSAESRELITGVCKLKDRLLLVVNTPKLLDCVTEQ